MKRRNREEAILVSCFILLAVFVYAGWKAFIVTIIALPFLWKMGTWWTDYKSKKQLKQLLSEKCEHGVTGAKFDSTLCGKCRCLVQQKSDEERIQRETRARKLEDFKRKEYLQWLEKIRLPEYLKTIDPQEFENLVCRLFSKSGYRVETTPYAGDNGSDGYLYKGEEKTVLQCKRVKGSVGEPILRDLYGTMHATKSQKAIVVTTGSVSKQAREWASGKPIKIIELSELHEMIKQNFRESDVVPEDFKLSEVALQTCPICGKQLRTVSGRRGPFIGCSGYPSCRFTQLLSP